MRPANFEVILLLEGGCPLSEVKIYCHGPVGLRFLLVTLIQEKLIKMNIFKYINNFQITELWYIKNNCIHKTNALPKKLYMNRTHHQQTPLLQACNVCSYELTMSLSYVLNSFKD